MNHETINIIIFFIIATVIIFAILYINKTTDNKDSYSYTFKNGMCIIVILDLKTSKFKDICKSKIYIDEKTADKAIAMHKKNNIGKYTYLKKTVNF